MSDQLKFPKIIMPNGKIYQDSIEPFQLAFHESKAKFRWLGGGVGGGKSAAATVEVLRQCWNHPNNYGFILRKTFPELRLSAIKDFYEITPNWMIVEDNRQEHWVDLYNHKGYAYYLRQKDALQSGKIKRRDYLKGLRASKGTSRVEFISFEGTEAAENKFRSANIGWYMVEQAEECGDLWLYDRLNERLRRVPSARQAWFISNPDGRDWLWDIFSPDSEGHRKNHEMFEVELSDNSNLPDDFHETLKDTYSEEDYARLVEGSFDVATGAVFPEFSFDTHVIPHFQPPDAWPKCLSLDHGLDNPTGAIFMTKFPTGEVYIYQEYYENEKLIRDHAAALKPHITPEFKYFTIDPTCVNREPISGATVIAEYQLAGIPFMPGVRDVIVGLNRIKEYMDFDPERMNPVTKALGSPRFFVSEKCPILIRQLQRYKWDTVKTNRGAQNKPEKPRKHFDHLIDPIRWGLLVFVPNLTSKSYVPETIAQPFMGRIRAKTDKFYDADAAEKLAEEARAEGRLPDTCPITIESLIQDATRTHRNSRTASWS